MNRQIEHIRLHIVHQECKQDHNIITLKQIEITEQTKKDTITAQRLIKAYQHSKEQLLNQELTALQVDQPIRHQAEVQAQVIQLQVEVLQVTTADLQ